MLTHRRRRTGRLGMFPFFPANAFTRAYGPPAPVKAALKEKAAPKEKMKRELGTDCCPVVRVKCEVRTIEVPTGKSRRVWRESGIHPESGETTGGFVTITTKKAKVKFCSVTAGSHKGDMMPLAEARKEVALLKSLGTQTGCKPLRVEGGGAMHGTGVKMGKAQKKRVRKGKR